MILKRKIYDKLNMNEGMLYENAIAQTLQGEVQGTDRRVLCDTPTRAQLQR